MAIKIEYQTEIRFQTFIENYPKPSELKKICTCQKGKNLLYEEEQDVQYAKKFLSPIVISQKHMEDSICEHWVSVYYATRWDNPQK